jgi:hypothetical protein
MRLPKASWPLRLAALAALLMTLAFSAVMTSPFARAQDDTLAGDFTVSITNEAVPQDIADGATIIGRWRISFNQDGSYEGERLDLGVLVRGSYTVDGDQVTITDEEGVVSCSNANMAAGGVEDVSTGTYQFELDSNSLKLTPVDEPCALRRVLLSTTELIPFVACVTEPIDLTSASAGGNNPGERGQGFSPGDVQAVDEASPTAEPVANPTEEVTEQATPESELSNEEQIDNLLSQMTACWATGEPERFLALWSDDLRGQFLQDETALDSLRAAMQVPFEWERAGDLRMDGDDRAEAVVRQTTLDQEEFARFSFVFEHGGWRWDGATAEN